MLEDGEISCSSIEDNSQESIHNGRDSLEDASINFTNSLRSSLPKSQSSNAQSDHSLIEQLFSMDCNPDQQAVASKPKQRKPFTMWSQQLIEEQANQVEEEQKIKINVNKNAVKKVRELPRTKREQKSLVNFAADIAHCLQERRKDIVLKIVESIGFDKASELCTEAQEVFKTGSMKTPDGRRKRTLGGCYFQLVKLKGNLEESRRKEIFNEPPTQKKKQLRKAKRKIKMQLQSPEKEPEENDQMDNSQPESNQKEIVDMLKDMNINVRFNANV